MAIEFLCPNGHRLSCGDDRAGTQGKCPKCNETFQVPATSELTPGGPPPRTTSTAPAQQLTAAAADDKRAADMIVFLCPKGHRLNGPATLQGQPGQCPHCGAKFRIPVVEPLEAVETPEDGGSTIETLEDGSELEEFEEIEEVDGDEEYVQPPANPLAGFLPPGIDEPSHSLAKLFPMLWNEKNHGAVLELQLTDGGTIVPDWWAERLSADSHAVFALQTADGSYVMETIPWEGVKRITVRRITELPGGVFE